MGLGDMMTGVFGGENKYKFQAPEQMEQDNFNRKLAQNQNLIRQARTQDTINFGDANRYGADMTQIAQQIQGGAANPINFGAAQGTQAQQQGLINTLIAQSKGQGPNPALAQLNMTRDQNAQQAMGMAASQRGVNPALAARMAGQNVASANQQAAGQAAVMTAQQQLAAQQQAGGLLATQAGQQAAQAQALAQQRLQQQQAAANIYGGQQQMLGQQAINQAQQRANLEGMRTQADLAYQKQIFDMYNSMNAINAGVASQNASTNFQYGAGALSGLSSALGGAVGMFNEGGQVPDQSFAAEIAKKVKGYAMGGDVSPIQFDFNTQMASAPSFIPNMAATYQSAQAQALGDIASAGAKMRESIGKATSMNPLEKMSKGSGQSIGGAVGDFPAAAPDLGAMALASSGGKIDGKAEVKGDHPKNDTVPALLSPGEIVIPRSKVKDPDEAHNFLDQVLAQNKKVPTFEDVLKAKRAYEQRQAEFEAFCKGGRV